MTNRIRWEDNEARWDDNGCILGCVGTRDEWLFQIIEASNDPDDETLALMVQLPGTDYRASEITQGTSPEELKAEAEQWLERFVVSLGASFPPVPPRPEESCNCPCGCPAPGQRDDDGTPGWCDSCRMNIHVEAANAAGTETTDA